MATIRIATFNAERIITAMAALLKGLEVGLNLSVPTEIRSGRQDKDPCDCATIIRAKGFHITSEQVCRLTDDSGLKNRPVVVRKLQTAQCGGSSDRTPPLWRTRRPA